VRGCPWELPRELPPITGEAASEEIPPMSASIRSSDVNRIRKAIEAASIIEYVHRFDRFVVNVTRRCSKLENTLFSEEESKIPRLIAILRNCDT
jgi:hypothetical protein